jgi:hypothetical protein
LRIAHHSKYIPAADAAKIWFNAEGGAQSSMYVLLKQKDQNNLMMMFITIFAGD